MADELDQSQHTQRGGGGRLEDDAVPGGQGGGQLPGGHQEGEVPGDDLAHNADGLPQDQAHHVAVQHRGLALFDPDGTGEVTEVVGRIGNVNGHGLADGLAVVHGLDGGQQLGVLVDDVSDLFQDTSSLCDAHVPPGREGSPGGLDGGIDIFLGGLGTLGQLLAGGGVVSGEDLPVGGGDPLSIDVQVISCIQVGFHSWCSFLSWQGFPRTLHISSFIIGILWRIGLILQEEVPFLALSYTTAELKWETPKTD